MKQARRAFTERKVDPSVIEDPPGVDFFNQFYLQTKSNSVKFMLVTMAFHGFKIYPKIQDHCT
jgi:hypothetical protein